MAIHDPQKLLHSLRSQPRETEWLEFKLNRFDPDDVGKYVSGLANSAMLANEEAAYLIFGVEDRTHNLVGTSVNLKNARVGAQNFEEWLNRLLSPDVPMEIIGFDEGGKHVEMIVIRPGYTAPVRFKREAFIRVDSVLKPLLEFEERERALWAITSRFGFEQAIAATRLSAEDIFDSFDCIHFMKLIGSNKISKTSVIDHLLLEGLIKDDRQGSFDVFNLFAIVAAKDLSKFPLLARRAPRVIQYKGLSKLAGVDEVQGHMGYGAAFPRLLRYVMGKLPHTEEMAHGVRKTRHLLPEISLREFIANALIHQDLTTKGSGPVIELFQDRVKITSPGAPLISPERFIDACRSRNEKLAGLMKRFGHCEERGSGIDRALEAIEGEALPPPLFQSIEGTTVVTVYADKPFAAMSKEDRLRACFQHAVRRFEANETMSNASLRLRLGLSDKQYPQVSVIIREAIEAKLIRPLDEDQAKRTARYLPAWAP